MDQGELLLIPAPRTVVRQAGTFCFRNGQQLVLYPPSVAEVLGAAQRLRDAVATEAGLAVQAVVGEVGDDSQVAVTLRLDPHAIAREQGYTLDIKPERVSIVGHDAPGVFYAVCTLSQLVRQFGSELPCLSIADHPDFPVRGVMLDVSRCKVPTLDTLTRLADWLAGFKVNQLQLYTEHTFAYREHREAWADASPVTGEDILQLDSYCRERFIELVPNQNSFGHLTQWLTHPKYNDLAEAPDGFDWPWGGHSDVPFSLNPTDPRSLDLLRSLYDDLLPHFSSHLFNVGCDETVDLGLGRSRSVCDVRGVHRVYLDFLLQIHRLVRERGRTMMFWGDIILHQPELIAELPKDVMALEWGYEFDHPFGEHCARFAAAEAPFYVCPGTSSWNAVAGRTDNAIGNLRSAADNGIRHGAIGYLNTDWGDHGHWQYQPTAYLGYVYGAAVSWASTANAKIDLAPALGLHAFGDPTGNMGRLAFDLGNVYQVYEQVTSDRLHNSSFLVRVLYEPVQQVANGFLDWQQVDLDVFRQARSEIDAATSLLPKARMRGPDAGLIQREYGNAARLLRHACGLGELKAALARGATGPSTQLKQQALGLAEDMRDILAAHCDLWLARNRVGGLQAGSGAHLQKMVDAYRQVASGL